MLDIGVVFAHGGSTIGTILFGDIAVIGVTTHTGVGVTPTSTPGSTTVLVGVAGFITLGFTTTMVMLQLPIEVAPIKIGSPIEVVPRDLVSGRVSNLEYADVKVVI